MKAIKVSKYFLFFHIEAINGSRAQLELPVPVPEMDDFREKNKTIADHLSGSDTNPRTEDRVFASHRFSGLRLATFFQLESKFKATAMLADGNEVREYCSCDVYVTPT